MEQNRKWSYMGAVAFLIGALLSIFVLKGLATSPTAFAKTKASLDDKKATVMELAAASTAASAAITLLPDDVGTPIAEKLMDLSAYFLIILTALYLEKFLLTLIGYASFLFLIPIGCACGIIYCIARREVCLYWAKKLIAFGLLLFLVIPVSVKASDVINDIYGDSIQATIAEAEQVAEQQELEEETDTTEEEDAGFFSGITDKVKEGINYVKDGITGTAEKLKEMVNHYLEAIAVMIVTSCLIPILILLLFVWLVKLFLGIEIPRISMSSVKDSIRGK